MNRGLRRGDIIVSRKGPFEHPQCYLGPDHKGTHYIAENSPKHGGIGKRAVELHEWKKVQRVEMTHDHLLEQTARNAEALVGKESYNLFTNNCEHTVNKIRGREVKSEQLRDWSVVAGAIAGVAAFIKIVDRFSARR